MPLATSLLVYVLNSDVSIIVQTININRSMLILLQLGLRIKHFSIFIEEHVSEAILKDFKLQI